MKPATWVKFVKEVAELHGFEVSDGEKVFEISMDTWHSAAFRVVQASTGYLEVSQWEQGEKHPEDGRFGRAVYSLRDSRDVALFCDILRSSAVIRARR